MRTILWYNMYWSIREEHKDGSNVTMICEQLYDLALLQNAPLSPEAMTKFIARSNEIMMVLTK